MELFLAIIGGGLLGFLANVVKSLFDKPLTRAQARDLMSKSRASDQDQVLKWATKWEEEILSREKERDAKRKELDDIHDRMKNMDGQLLTIHQVNGSLESQILEKNARIRELEGLVASHGTALINQEGKIGMIIRKTGSLDDRMPKHGK